MDTYGGRVISNFNTLQIRDVAHVPHDVFDRLRGCRIEVLSDNTSLSGFAVRITRRESKTVRVFAAWVVLSWMFYLVSCRIQGTII